MRHVVLRLDPDTGRGIDRGAADPQCFEVEALHPGIPGTGEPERHGPRRLVRRHRQQCGPHLLRMDEFPALGGSRDTEVEGDTVPACLGDEAGERGHRADAGHGEPPGLALGGLRLVQQHLGRLHELPGRRQHVPAEGSEDGSTRGALEQLLAEAFLEGGDATAGHGLRHPGGCGADGEAPVLTHADERATCRHQIHGPTLCLFGMEQHRTVLDRMVTGR